MKKKKAIKILKDEVRHTKQHMNVEGKDQVFYDEMQDYIDATKMAIKALKKSKKARKYANHKKDCIS